MNHTELLNYLNDKNAKIYFDWKFYLDYYKDLRDAGLKTEEDALNHWNKYGKKNGRICNKNQTKENYGTFHDFKDNIIFFEPIKNISTAFTSQYIRLLYPAILDYKGGILISDIDIIPMNNTYFSSNILKFSNEKFIYLRDVLLIDKQIAMCYNVAINKIWKDIFKISCLDDITKRLKEVYLEINYADKPGMEGWFHDQLDLYKYVNKWDLKTNNFVYLKDCELNFERLDRVDFKLNERVIKNIKNGFYCDYHCLRPFKKYEKINIEVYQRLKS